MPSAMKCYVGVVCLLLGSRDVFALGQARFVQEIATAGGFTIAQGKTAAPVYVDSKDWPGVVRAAHDLQADVARVTGTTPVIVNDDKSLGSQVILTGTIGKSELIDRLIRDQKIDVSPVAGKWESFLIQVVAKPMPGVASALVIAGSDKRGTIFGIYDLSEQMGVSPWYFWADVPTTHKDALFVKPVRYVEGEPAVKYRGIFLNDEAPALSGWVKEKFGDAVPGSNGWNHKFYETVFELVLRMKGNFMWPAMWGSAFNEDDPVNPKLADEYGIVMSTSHHEPMMRAQQEWKRHGTGEWDYSKNADVLKNFWSEGVHRNRDYENFITLAMRGDGDRPMAGNSMDANVKLLEQIVTDQRKIIAEQVNPDVTKVPQVWALYKEVQEYYEKGMRVPDDVTLLWCDDNWGNIRRLPTADERKRAGGAGIYYHFDYVGGPRNYKWLNTNPIAKVWEQMNQALAYGANRIWVVNVGDLKPMEFPIEYFLNLARDPKRWPKEKLAEYTRMWSEREFGKAHGAEVGEIIDQYTRFNGRRKPELLEPVTFSLENYQEADRVADAWKALTAKAERLSAALPANARDAFFELALHPAKASAQVTELYIAAAKNRLYASQGRASTNGWAAATKALYQADADLTTYYNQTLLNGKWSHMMDQTHIGYTIWQEPRTNSMPAVKEIELPDAAEMGVALEGSTAAWPGAKEDAVLPGFDVYNQPRRYIDVFNKGKAPFEFTATASAPWITLSSSRGTVEKEQRLWVTVDWRKAPAGSIDGTVKIARAGANDVTVKVMAVHPQQPTRTSLDGFVEADGYVSIEAEHYTKRVDAGPARWEKIEGFGRTLSGMSLFPVMAASVMPPQTSPCLEYKMYLFEPGKVEVESILGPTLNFVPGRGLRYAISFDDQPPQVVDALAHHSQRDWETTVKDSVRKVISTHTVTGTGYHTLKFWMVDPGVVLEKLVVNLGGVKPSYLGPPESYRKAASTAALSAAAK